MRSPFTYLVSLAALLLALIILTSGAFSAAPFAMPGEQSETTQQPKAEAETEHVFVTDYVSGLAYRAMRMQQEYFRGLAKAFRSFDLERSFDAAFALISISFAYGIFHAVGPGHGKFIVSSYLLADERDVKRGIGLAFASSFAQAVTAIVLVGALAIVLGLTHRAVADSVPTIERVSFLFVIGVGAVLLWRALRPAHTHDDHHGHGHDHAHHDHDGHAHMPTPAEVRKIHDWRDMAGIVLAVGLRPCTGAILVLLFALTQNAFLIGALSSFAISLGTAITVSVLAVLTLVSKNVALRVAGTADNRWTMRIERGLKIAGGLFILALGLFMLAGSFILPPQPLL
ncbi:MAG: nickel/cobalt transporter [Parvibaculum sp.]|nr:nickel/cobalt transporter [Parvibaculum sp.]